MKLFNYHPDQYQEALKRDGYALLKGVVSQEFLGYIGAFVEAQGRAPDMEREDGYVAGKKRQLLFDFPSDAVALEFRDEIAALTELNPATFTLSERHVKLYAAEAAAKPFPHKDRSASLYSIGVPVTLSEMSTVCIFPQLGREINSEQKAVFLNGKAVTDPSALYAAPETVKFHEALGDMIIFEGSALYHERENPAGVAILYLKINDEGFDPLNENPAAYKAV